MSAWMSDPDAIQLILGKPPIWIVFGILCMIGNGSSVSSMAYLWLYLLDQRFHVSIYGLAGGKVIADICFPLQAARINAANGETL